MPLEDALARVPGLAGYLGTQQFQQQQQAGQLGQMGSLVKIHAAIKAQQEGDQIKAILAKSPDLQTALPELIKLGPAGIAVGKHLAEVQQAQQDAAMGADVQKMIPKDQSAVPSDVYRALGMKMGLRGKVGGSALISEADRMDKLAQEKQALTGMQSAPEVPAVGAQGPNVPAPAKPGVVADFLLSDPQFGPSAKALQGRINSGVFPTATAAEAEVSRLTSAYNAAQQTKALVGMRGAEARKTKMTMDPTGMITPEARTAAAARYNIDGTLPSNLGRGNQGAANTVSILNEAAQNALQSGDTPEAQRIRQISNKASTIALNQLSKDLAAIGPFEQMLNTNAKIAIDLSKKISDSRTGSQFVNRPLTWLQTNAKDNPDIAEYLFQMQTVKTEGARILNNPRLVGQLTDSARHEMGDVINGNMPLGQTERVLNRMMSDGRNRVTAMQAQKGILLQGMGQTPAQSPTSEQDGWKITPVP